MNIDSSALTMLSQIAPFNNVKPTPVFQGKYLFFNKKKQIRFLSQLNFIKLGTYLVIVYLSSDKLFTRETCIN